MSLPPLVFQVLMLLMVCLAAIYDIRFRRIPNWLVLSGLLLGLGLNVFLSEWQGLRLSLLGLGLASLIYFPLYLLRGMGAGDVKLMMALGSMVGWANWLGIFVITSILGGVVAMLLLVSRGKLRTALVNVQFLLQNLLSFRAPYAREELDLASPKSMKLPHGVVIAAGTLLFLIAARVWAPR
jgi:prepilin peptidase CpaA